MAGRNMQQSAQIDLHGLTCSEAKVRLEQKIKSLPVGTKELTVIHGYHGGKQLAEMVRRLGKQKPNLMRSLGQIFPYAMLKILEIRQYSCVFLPCLQENLLPGTSQNRAGENFL